MLYVIEDIGGRPYQEDRHSVKTELIDNYDYIAVFDGHGGHQVSDFLKFNMKDFVKKELQSNVGPVQALKNAFQSVHNSLPLDISFTTGSAAIVILKKGSEIWVANSGDCRATMSSSIPTRPITLSVDHKPNRDDEYARITNLGGHVTFNKDDVPRVQGNLALSRSIGDKYLAPFVIPDPEIKHFNINEKNRYIVMASDGVWDVYSNSEVIIEVDEVLNKDETVHLKTRMRNACFKLLTGSRQKGSTDNVTILLWML